jgi:hypothetical protein
MFIFKDSSNVTEDFKLFYWLREPAMVKKFTKRVKEFKNM